MSARASDPVTGAVRQRYKLTVAYDGTLFHGWQQQEPPGKAVLRTVAGVMETGIATALQQPINLVGSSRTDAGVHALAQVAQFDAATRMPVYRMADAINSRLPMDVEVRQVEVAAPDFNAVMDARRKQYRYRIYVGANRPLHRRNYVWHCWYALDVERMNAGAQRIVGTHDFSGMANARHGRLTTVRTVYDCRVEQHDDEIHMVICGSGFLFNMVRIIAGTLVEIGRGYLQPEVIDEVYATGNRRLAGSTLDPHGLWLEWIEHGPPGSGPAPGSVPDAASAIGNSGAEVAGASPHRAEANPVASRATDEDVPAVGNE